MTLEVVLFLEIFALLVLGLYRGEVSHFRLLHTLEEDVQLKQLIVIVSDLVLLVELSIDDLDGMEEPMLVEVRCVFEHPGHVSNKGVYYFVSPVVVGKLFVIL